MIPPHLAQDMIRAANLALWSTRDHRRQAEGFTLALGKYIHTFGSFRFHKACGVNPHRLMFHRPDRKQIQPHLLTILRILPALGLRLRVEADPDPRSLMRPITSRLRFEQKLHELEQEDPTGELARQFREHDERRRARRAPKDRAYSRARRKANK